MGLGAQPGAQPSPMVAPYDCPNVNKVIQGPLLLTGINFNSNSKVCDYVSFEVISPQTL